MTNTLAKTIVLGGLLCVLGGVAVVRRAGGPDPLAPETLARLLERPIDPVPGAPVPIEPVALEPGPRDSARGRPPFWKALLTPPLVESTDVGLRLRLGRVLADPSAARGSAESAGELLELEAVGPDGPLGMPLWRAILERAASSDGAQRTLAVYGCRHSADADAGPVLEDTYHARLALVGRLRELARTEKGALPLTIRGEEMPVKGGINLEVQLDGERQWVRVTFDGGSTPALHVERAHRPPAPNDARARAALVAGLEALAARAPELGALEIEGRDAPVAGGVDLRFETIQGRLALVAWRGSTRVGTHLVLVEPAPANGADSTPAAQ